MFCATSPLRPQALVAFLRGCRDAIVLIDVLKLITEWLTPQGEDGRPGSIGAALIERLTELAQHSEVDNAL